MTRSTPLPAAAPTQKALPREERAWRSRPLAALALEVVMLLGPLAASGAVVWAATPLVRDAGTTVRWTALLLLGLTVGLLSQRLARRVLPLRALLRLTMVFPDSAPSRYRVARSAGRPQALVERLRSPDVTEAEAAQLVLALVAAMRRHDRHTRGHSERVRAYTDLLSESLGWSEQARDRLRWAALLHDVGKIEVPTTLLNKPGSPTSAEWEVLRAHPRVGHELTRALHPWLGEWGDAVLEHHEKYDGTGYPAGLWGEGISPAGRLVAVVDCFETMTAVRAYKKAMSHRAARAELARCAGTHFDPAMVRAFLAISVPRLVWAMGPLSALLQLPFIASFQAAGGRAADLATVSASTAGSTAVAGGLAAGLLVPIAPLASVVLPGAVFPALDAPAATAYAAEDPVEPVFGPQTGLPARSALAKALDEGKGKDKDKDKGEDEPVQGPPARPGRSEADDEQRDAAKEQRQAAKEREKAQREQAKAAREAADEQRKAEQDAAEEQEKAAERQRREAEEADEDRRKAAERQRREAEEAEEDRLEAVADAAEVARKDAERAARDRAEALQDAQAAAVKAAEAEAEAAREAAEDAEKARQDAEEEAAKQAEQVERDRLEAAEDAAKAAADLLEEQASAAS